MSRTRLGLDIRAVLGRMPVQDIGPLEPLTTMTALMGATLRICRTSMLMSIKMEVMRLTREFMAVQMLQPCK